MCSWSRDVILSLLCCCTFSSLLKHKYHVLHSPFRSSAQWFVSVCSSQCEAGERMFTGVSAFTLEKKDAPPAENPPVVCTQKQWKNSEWEWETLVLHTLHSRGHQLTPHPAEKRGKCQRCKVTRVCIRGELEAIVLLVMQMLYKDPHILFTFCKMYQSWDLLCRSF